MRPSPTATENFAQLVRSIESAKTGASLSERKRAKSIITELSVEILRAPQGERVVLTRVIAGLEDPRLKVAAYRALLAANKIEKIVQKAELRELLGMVKSKNKN